MSDAVGRGLVEDLLAASMDGVALLSESHHRQVNDAYAEAFGADSPDALVETEWRERFPPDVAERIAAASDDEDAGGKRLPGVACVDLDGDRFAADLSVRHTSVGVLVVVRPVDEGERRDRERVLTALHDAVHDVQEAQTPAEVYERSVDAAHEVLDWPMSVCWRHDDQSNRLVPVATRGVDGDRFAPGDPEYEVFEAGDPEVRDVSKACDHLPGEAEQGLLFPLGDRGMLGAAVTDRRGFTDWEFETMEVLATHVEAALARVQRELDLRESEERYRELVEAAPTPIGIIDRGGDFVYVNRAGADFLGVDHAEDAVGMAAQEFVDEEYRERALTAVRRTIEDGRVSRPMEVHYRTLDGRERAAVGATSPITWDGERATQVVLNDVTEYRRSQERYERLVETAPIPIAIVSREGELAYCNQAAADFHGAEGPEDLVGRPAMDLVHEDAHATAHDHLETVVEEGEPITGVERRFHRLDGEERVAMASLAPIIYEGEPAVQVVLKDVTERKRRERQLEESERRYRTIAENFPNGAVVLFDRDLRFTVAGGEVLDDLPLPEMEGATAYELFEGDEELEKLIAAYEDALDGEPRVLNLEYDDRKWLVRILPVRDDDGEVFAGVSISQDVTEQRERERELRRKERRYRTLADRIPNAAVALFEPSDDGELWYSLVTGSTFDRVSIDAEDMEGERLADVHTDSFVRDHLPHFWAALDGESRTFDFELDGRAFRGFTLPVEDEDGEIFSGMAMTLDVTEQRERERELRRKERQYRTLAERIPNAVVSLYEPTEDGDLRYTLLAGSAFEKMSFDAEDLEGRLLKDVHSESFVRDHLPHFRAALDGESGTFEFTLEGRTYQGFTLPVTDDEGEVISGMAMSLDVTEQRERERELERQRDELETINRINGLLLNITRALSEAPTREEVETTVCERLASSDLYRFAWIGERAIRSDTLTPRASAGVDDGYLEEVSVESDQGLAGSGPAGEAMRTGEVQVVGDVREDQEFAPWREAAEKRGYRSVAAVPLTHGDTVYGILAVYSARIDAFSDREQAAFAILGETIGFVINALQNRKLLVADTVTELTFEVSDPSALLVALSDTFDATVTLEGHTETDENVWLAYLGVDGADPSAVVEYLLDEEVHGGIEDAWVIQGGDDGGLVGLRETDPSFVTAVLEAGASLQQARATDGTLRTTLEVPGAADVRHVVELLQGVYPGIELVAQRERDRPVRTAAEFRESLEEHLTERQLAALRAAYYGGYFEWPRESTAEDVAESMGIASATLHNHLRKAQRQLLSLFFEEDTGSDSGRDAG